MKKKKKKKKVAAETTLIHFKDKTPGGNYELIQPQPTEIGLPCMSYDLILTTVSIKKHLKWKLKKIPDYKFNPKALEEMSL